MKDLGYANYWLPGSEENELVGRIHRENIPYTCTKISGSRFEYSCEELQITWRADESM